MIALRTLLRTVCAGVAAHVLLAGCARAPVERVEWTVMGTVAAVQWKGPATPSVNKAVAVTKETFAEVETLLNAHVADSEIRRLATATDGDVLARCSPLVRPCYAAAFRLRDETVGLFNPRWRGKGTLDLGAIAKGFAVDLAVRRIERLCDGTDLLVDLGGNLRSARGAWTTGVADPQSAEDGIAETFALTEGAASATSGEYYRGHHIRDGRTGAEAKATVASVTVIHPTSAMEADGLSTVLFLLGREKGTAYLGEHAPGARAIWISIPTTKLDKEEK